MKTRITLRLLCLGALGSLIVAASNCADQREPECTSPAAGHFPTRLTATNIPPGCEGEDLKAIVVATRSYYVLDGDGNVDYDEPFNVAIQTIEMGEQFIGLEDAEEFDVNGEAVNRLAGGVSAASLIENNKLYAYGRFTTPRPDGNDQCYIPTTQPAVLESPGLVQVIIPDDPTTEEVETDDPETMDVVETEEIVPEEPGFRYEAQWSNITFLVSTAYPGVQFAGTLVYTRPHSTVPGMSCSITYDAVGVSAVNTYDCSTPDQDDPETPENENAPYYRAEGYNQALCGAEADFSQGITIGAGINPDFPIECDPDTKLCLLRGPFRSGATNL